MHTENSITIRAPVETVYKFAADIERWPELLPHYRRVRILEQNGNTRLAEMAAKRDGIPVRWWGEQTLFPEIPRITYRHVRGITKAMSVSWTFEPAADGVEVTITHDLRLRWPLLGGWVADRIIGPFFVANIAGKTLRTIKSLTEAEAAQTAAETSQNGGVQAE